MGGSNGLLGGLIGSYNWNKIGGQEAQYYMLPHYMLQSNSKVLSYQVLNQEAKSVYKTQKVLGLEAGWVMSNISGYGYKVAPHAGIMPYLPVDKIKALAFPKFARPAPLTPRHGFVESRDVNSLEELQAVFDEARKEDPDAELIIMDRLTGKYSGVMTATGVTWGKSNDGVTSGKGRQIIIPTPAGDFDDRLLPYLKGKPADGVYCEFVEDKDGVCVVQMRLGPKQPDSRMKRFTRALSVNIGAVIQPDSDDLIAWDRKLRQGNVHYVHKRCLVWLPGQSMSSHFAVQAIAQGYNVSIEETCPIDVCSGGILRSDTNAMAPLEPSDYKRLAECFAGEKQTVFWDYPRDVLLTVGVLHSTPYWDGQPHLLALRARGAMIAARFGLAACLGESRHLLKSGGKQKPTVPWESLIGAFAMDEFRPSRSYVFTRAFTQHWEDGPKLALAAATDLRLPKQPPVMEHLAEGGAMTDYAATYMGMKWEYAALRVHDLHVAIDRFCADPNEGNWGAILGQYNEIINAAHNGGYLLNKWCGQDLIDNAATMPAIVFGFRNVMKLVWTDDTIPDGPKAAPSPWVKLTKVSEPSEYTVHFEKMDCGVFVPKVIMENLAKEGAITSDFTCSCTFCMASLWKKIGKLCLAYGKVCFVPGEMLAAMPTIWESPEDDDYMGHSVSLVPNAEFEPIKPIEAELEEICSECSSALEEDGTCDYCKELAQAEKAEAEQDEEKAPSNGDDLPKPA